MNIVSGPPSPQAQEMLKVLQDRLTKELQRKQKPVQGHLGLSKKPVVSTLRPRVFCFLLASMESLRLWQWIHPCLES